MNIKKTISKSIFLSFALIYIFAGCYKTEQNTGKTENLPSSNSQKNSSQKEFDLDLDFENGFSAENTSEINLKASNFDYSVNGDEGSKKNFYFSDLTFSPIVQDLKSRFEAKGISMKTGRFKDQKNNTMIPIAFGYKNDAAGEVEIDLSGAVFNANINFKNKFDQKFYKIAFLHPSFFDGKNLAEMKSAIDGDLKGFCTLKLNAPAGKTENLDCNNQSTKVVNEKNVDHSVVMLIFSENTTSFEFKNDAGGGNCATAVWQAPTSWNCTADSSKRTGNKTCSIASCEGQGGCTGSKVVTQSAENGKKCENGAWVAATTAVTEDDDSSGGDVNFDDVEIIQIAAGGYHSLALDKQGRVWAWGGNYKGQLGDGTTEKRLTPVQVKNLSEVTQIVAGGYHSLALKSDGTVWAWGENSYGQLGDWTTEDKLTPVQVRNLSGVTQIAAGLYHSLALKSDGTVRAWGQNNSGELGYTDNGIEKYKSTTPKQVKNLSDVTQIAAGHQFSLVLKLNGTVWAWGYNFSGQLGDGTKEKRLIPTQVKNLSDVTQIVVESRSVHPLALKSDGTVWAWGRNSEGQLGDGTTEGRLIPVPVKNFSGVIQIIAVGGYHSLALKSDGTVWAWGYNDYSQLGDGTKEKRLTPTQVKNLSEVTQIVAGEVYSLALKSDGTVWAWGQNNYGQLGDGTTENRSTPVPVSSFSGATPPTSNCSTATWNNWGAWQCTESDTKRSHTRTCSVSTCAGSGGCIGSATATETAPTGKKCNSANPSGAWIDAGTASNCNTATFGSWSAWQCIENDTKRRRTRTCSVSNCVGSGGCTGPSTDTLIPAEEGKKCNSANPGGAWIDIGENSGGDEVEIIQIEAGYNHSLALDKQGRVWAWGEGENCQLGYLRQYGSEDVVCSSSDKPVLVPGLSSVVKIIAKGNASYAIKSDKTLWQWGGDNRNISYDHNYTDDHIPKKIFSDVVQISFGIGGYAGRTSYALMLKSDGTIWGWGSSLWTPLELGEGVFNVGFEDAVRQLPQLADIKQVGASGEYSFALKSDGTVWFWGGYDTAVSKGRVDLMQLEALSDIVKISVSEKRLVALKSDGTTWSCSSYPTDDCENPRKILEDFPNVVNFRNDGGFIFFAINSDGETLMKHEVDKAIDNLSNVIDLVFIGPSYENNTYFALKSDGSVWEWRNDRSPNSVQLIFSEE